MDRLASPIALATHRIRSRAYALMYWLFGWSDELRAVHAGRKGRNRRGRPGTSWSSARPVRTVCPPGCSGWGQPSWGAWRLQERGERLDRRVGARRVPTDRRSSRSIESCWGWWASSKATTSQGMLEGRTRPQIHSPCLWRWRSLREVVARRHGRRRNPSWMAEPRFRVLRRARSSPRGRSRPAFGFVYSPDPNRVVTACVGCSSETEPLPHQRDGCFG